MANCPHCAERFGWLHLLRRATSCAHCHLPLRTDGAGKVETYASRHADEILRQAHDERYWSLLVIGVVATLVVALLPTFGLLTLVLLPIIQAICLERSVQRYREHFGILHGLTVDFYSSIFFLGLVAAQSIANALAHSAAALVAVPLYLLAWWGYGAYCRWHFRRVAAGLQPAWSELSLIGLLVGLLVLAPTLLLIVVLFSYFGG